MAKKNTPTYQVLQDAKNSNKEDSKPKKKKKLDEMNDAEKVQYYKDKLSTEKKKYKKLEEEYNTLSKFIDENYAKLSAKDN